MDDHVSEHLLRADRLSEYLKRAEALSERIDLKQTPGEEKAYGDAMLAEMRKAELLAVCVPERLGGPGLGVEEIAKITFEIARQSGSAGLIYAMHMSQAYSICMHGEGEHFEEVQRRMLAGQLLIASGTSEKGPGGDILTSLCHTEVLDDGSLGVTKESPNISYIDHADLILVTAMHTFPDGRDKQVLAVGNLERDNFEGGRAAAFMGMRGILNSPYKFRVEFPQEAIFDVDFGAVARQSMTPSIHIFWAALWSGIAWAVVDKAKRFVGDTVKPDSDANSLMQYELTRLVDQHHAMNSMIRSAMAAYAAREEATDLGFGLSVQINRVKVNCSELLLDICTRALKIIGIRGYAAGGPYTLAEHIADAMSAPVMVSNYRLALNSAKVERFVDESL